MLRPLMITALALLLAACGGGAWPKLNAPLPNTEQRSLMEEEGASAVLQPVAPETGVAASLTRPATTAEAVTLLADAETRIAEARAAFEDSLDQVAGESEPSERAVKWRGAQMALTRVTMALGTLDGLMVTEGVDFAALRADAETLIRDTRRYARAASERLMALSAGR